MMQPLRAPLVRLLLTALWLLPSTVLAASGGGEPIVLVADSRRFTGWKAWWTNLYNESHLLFALFTILIIPSVGLLLGKLVDLIMASIGINLKSRVLAEH